VDGHRLPDPVLSAFLIAAGRLSDIFEGRGRHPIVDFGFFRRRNFGGSTIVIFVLDFSFGALLFFLPLYFQEVLGYTPTQAGVLLLPLTGVMVVGSPLGGRMAVQVGAPTADRDRAGADGRRGLPHLDRLGRDHLLAAVAADGHDGLRRGVRAHPDEPGRDERDLA
jgi:MFS transporter